MQFSIHNRLVCISSIFLCLFGTLFITSTFSYAASDKSINVGISAYSPPIFFDENDLFTINGISVDMAKIIADNMDATLKFYIMDDLDYAEALEKGTVDFVIGIKDDFESLETVNLIETEIRVNRHFFVNSECVTFTSLKDLPGHTVIVRGGDFISRILSSRSDISFIDPKTEEEGFTLLDSGKVQVFISHSRLMDLDAIKKLGFHNIREVGKPVKNAPLVIASNQKNEELNASLRKAYEKTVSSIEYSQILNFWVNRDVQFVDADKRSIILFLTPLYKYIKIMTGIVIIAFVGIIFWNNMLKRKVNKVKKDLYQSEQRYKDLIESSPDMIHLVFQNGRIRLSNKMALNCLGYNENEMSLLKLHDLVSAEDVEKVTAFLDRVFKDNYSKSEFTFLTKDGTGIYVEMVGTIAKWDPNGESLACAFSRDLTERKRLEENLIHSDRLAVMGRMAAGIAHEINNPLGIILTNIGVLINQSFTDEDSLENCKSIERNALRAAKIIEDLLSFTRPSPLNKVSIDLIPLIDESLLFLKHRIKKKDIKVEKLYPDSPLIFRGDEKMIQQLLINLILNAIQAVRDEARITITAGVTEGFGEPMISIEIKDNGIGISIDDIPKIGNPFYTSRKDGGFGLGVFISKIIAEKHNGNISFKSELFKGTVVTINFPLGAETTSSAN